MSLQKRGKQTDAKISVGQYIYMYIYVCFGIPETVFAIQIILAKKKF